MNTSFSFVHEGKELGFSCTREGIPGFCGGVVLWNFFLGPVTKGRTYSYTAVDAKNVIEQLYLLNNTALLSFHDTKNGMGMEFLRMLPAEWEDEDGMTYSVYMSEPFHNWNSGNECIVTSIVVSGKEYETDEDEWHDSCSCSDCQEEAASRREALL